MTEETEDIIEAGDMMPDPDIFKDISDEIKDIDEGVEKDDTGDSISFYLSSIGRVPLLTQEEEIALCVRIEKGRAAEEKNKELQESLLSCPKKNRKNILNAMSRNRAKIADGKAAGDELVNRNLRLVVSVAKQYAGRKMQFLDLVQEGNIGLMRAVEMFDYRKGFRFSTYATWWIRQAITRGLTAQDNTIRLPVHVVDQIWRMKKAIKTLVSELGREPDIKEIAGSMGISEEKVKELIKNTADTVSLDAPVGDEGENSLGDMIGDETSLDPQEKAMQTMLKNQIDSVLNSLTERERDILIDRFGLHDREPMTLEELGKKHNLTRERIRQIEAKAIYKLQMFKNRKKLKDFI